MRRIIGLVVATGLLLGLSNGVHADDAKAVIDKAVKALGGPEKIEACKAASWKIKGKISIGGNDSEFTSQITLQGLDHFRQEFEGEFNGNAVKFVTIVAGDKGWRKRGDEPQVLENEQLANQKRIAYLQAVPTTVLPLTQGGFKVESVSEEKIGDKPVVEIKASGPDGKDFQLSFDKASGLPVRMVAKVAGRQGEYTQETTYADYKDFGGIKRATKIEVKRDGEKFMEQTVSDFKCLDKVDPKAFAEP